MTLIIVGVIFYGLMALIFGAFLWRVNRLKHKEEEE